jgi:hypothetical protein
MPNRLGNFAIFFHVLSSSKDHNDSFSKGMSSMLSQLSNYIKVLNGSLILIITIIWLKVQKKRKYHNPLLMLR